MPKYKSRASRRRSTSYKKKKNAGRRKAYRRKKKMSHNYGGGANELRTLSYRSVGYRPYIRAIAVFNKNLTLVPTSGVYSPVLFRGNGPYDPEYALGGATCQNWAEISALGIRYYCYAASIEVEEVPQAMGSTVGTYFQNLNWVAASNTTALNFTNVQELRSASGHGLIAWRGHSLGEGNRKSRYRLGRTTRMMIPYANPSGKWSTMSTTPVDQWFFVLSSIDMNGDATTTLGIRLNVRIKYYCLIENVARIAFN